MLLSLLFFLTLVNRIFVKNLMLISFLSVCVQREHRYILMFPLKEKQILGINSVPWKSDAKMQEESRWRKGFHAKMKREVAMRWSFKCQPKQRYAKNCKGRCELGMRHCAKGENNQQESGWSGSHVGLYYKENVEVCACFLPKWVLIMTTLIARDFMFKIH